MPAGSGRRSGKKLVRCTRSDRPYPAETLAAQFARVAEGWEKGLGNLARAVEAAPANTKSDVERELQIAHAALLHFRSVANQTKFMLARNAVLNLNQPLAPVQRAEKIAELRRVVEDEIRLARQLYSLTRTNSCIGFEAANQYFYLPHDLMEKVINCRYILDEWLRYFPPTR
ncbi:MAG: hypothetical protein N3D11_03550 [Candidatus Sumerlaeia bacterium]|nr:hypothetical protein [Candidatus Sumerlaeia bacterium]